MIGSGGTCTCGYQTCVLSCSRAAVLSNTIYYCLHICIFMSCCRETWQVECLNICIFTYVYIITCTSASSKAAKLFLVENWKIKSNINHMAIKNSQKSVHNQIYQSIWKITFLFLSRRLLCKLLRSFTCYVSKQLANWNFQKSVHCQTDCTT